MGKRMRYALIGCGRISPNHIAAAKANNLEIVAVDVENNAILVKGNIPGPKKSLVTIRSAVKNPNKVNKRADLISWDKEDNAEVSEVKED